MEHQHIFTTKAAKFGKMNINVEYHKFRMNVTNAEQPKK